MNIIYTRQAQQQLKSIKSFIEQDNPQAAKTHLIKIKSKTPNILGRLSSREPNLTNYVIDVY